MRKRPATLFILFLAQVFRLRRARAARFLIMNRKRYLSVTNFDALQHYKDRNPIWIKLHCAILDDYEFSALPDETKFHAVSLMLLASRLNNKFPDDEAWLRRRIGANVEINLKVLLEIDFLEVVKEEKTSAKNAANARKSKKINDDPASATLDDAGKDASPEQNRTEQKRTEQKRTQHNTPDEDENGRAESGADAKNVVVVVGDFKSFSGTESEAENEAENGNQNQAKTFGNKSDSAGEVNGSVSRFSLEDCLKYARQSDGVKNPNALANNLHQTGKADAFIMAMLYPREAEAETAKIYGSPIGFTNDPCSICFGAKLSDTDGKGYRRCVHCKDERGKATGREPSGC